jgi:hypothetical protein
MIILREIKRKCTQEERNKKKEGRGAPNENGKQCTNKLSYYETQSTAKIVVKEDIYGVQSCITYKHA